MSPESVLVSEVIPAPRERIYQAWLSSTEHAAFTGEDAQVEPVVGGRHSAFGGYATGQNVELEPFRRIVQTWRSSEFPIGAPDSRLEVTLEETLGGTLVTILHTQIPAGQADRYREGWIEYYLERLKRHFGQGAEPSGSEDVTQVAIPRPHVNGHPESARGALANALAAHAPTTRRSAPAGKPKAQSKASAKKAAPKKAAPKKAVAKPQKRKKPPAKKAAPTKKAAKRAKPAPKKAAPKRKAKKRR